MKLVSNKTVMTFCVKRYFLSQIFISLPFNWTASLRKTKQFRKVYEHSLIVCVYDISPFFMEGVTWLISICYVIIIFKNECIIVGLINRFNLCFLSTSSSCFWCRLKYKFEGFREFSLLCWSQNSHPSFSVFSFCAFDSKKVGKSSTVLVF